MARRSIDRVTGRARRQLAAAVGRTLRPQIEPLEPRQLLSAVVYTLATFPVNSQPGSLIIDSAGDLFGTTQYGGTDGDGSIFEVAAGTHALTTLVSFDGTDTGSNPVGNLFEDATGNIFGTTAGGGLNGEGTVFELTAGSHDYILLATFDGETAGGNPEGSIYVDGSGDVFGTTTAGGNGSAGTLYELTAGSQVLNPLIAFNSAIGGNPIGGIISDGAGNLYGTTTSGAGGNGNIFKYAIAGADAGLSTLAEFNQPLDVSTPLTIDSAGDLFAVAQRYSDDGNNDYGDGSVFELAPGQSTVQTLHSFIGSDGDEGVFPEGGLTLDSNGVLFGTTYAAGTLGNGNSGDGTVYSISASDQTPVVDTVFTGDNGYGPVGSLAVDSAGNLYGVTQGSVCGSSGSASVYELAGSGFDRPSLTTTAAAGQTATRGVSQSFNLGQFAANQYTAGPYNISVNWGDSTAATTFSTSTPGPIAMHSHTYATTGTYTATVTVTDSESPGLSSGSTLPITVAAATPAFTSIAVHVYQETSQAGTATTPAAGRQVYVDLNGTGIYQYGDPTGVTGSDGSATISIAGYTRTSYQVGQILPAGAAQAYPAQTLQTVTQSNASSVTFRDFTPSAVNSGSGAFYTKYSLPNLVSQGDSAYVTDAVTQLDGKIVTTGVDGGKAFVERALADGEPDQSFGNGGIALGPEELSNNSPGGVVEEPNGDIVIDGTGAGGVGYAMRFLPDGAVDSSFSYSAGSSSTTPTGLTLMPDGSLLVSGTQGPGGSSVAFVTDLSAANGSPVAGFGTGGTTTYGANLSGGASLPVAPLLTSTGKLDLLVATSGEPSLVVLTGTGTYQSSTAVAVNGGLSGYQLETAALQRNGQIIVGGVATSPVDGLQVDIVVARLNSNGTLDSAFGSGGIVYQDSSGSITGMGAVTLTSAAVLANGSTGGVTNDGVILLTGKYAYSPGDGDNTFQCFCQEYNQDGTLDFGYGNSNTLTVPVSVMNGGAPLANPSGFLPSVNASASSTVAIPEFQPGGVGFFLSYYPPPAMVVGQGVADLNVETTAPTATWQTPATVTGANSAPEILQVEYKDQVSLKLSTIGTGNLTVTHGGVTETATYIGASSGTAQDFYVDYSVAPPNGSAWTTSNNGTYTVALQADQVGNSSKFAAANPGLGTFTVAVTAAAVGAPVAAIAPVPTVTATGTAVTVSVTYTGTNQTINASSIGIADLAVTGPAGTLTVTAATAGTAAGDTLPVTYTVAAPAGGWTTADNGTYTISLVAGQVTDSAGSAAAAATLGTFAVAIGAPAAALAAVPPVTTAGTTVLTLSVTYTDATPVKLSTIGVGNITVASLGGTALTVTGATASTTADADSITVTYTVAAPAGGFTAGDDGTYSVELVGGQIANTNGTSAPASTLGLFTVAVAVPLSVTTTTLSNPIPAVNSGIISEFTATVTTAGTTAPTGTVAFYDGSTLLATEPVAGGAAVYSTALLPVGSDSVTAVYSGDAANAGSTSAATVVTVTGPAAGAPVLTPVFSKTVLKPSAVAGAVVRQNLTVTITNTGGVIERGLVHVNFFVSTDPLLDATDTAVGSVKHNVSIKPGKAGAIGMQIVKFPVNLPGGTYYVLAQVIDAAGFANFVATGQTIVIAAPVIIPTVTVAKLTSPAVLVTGKKVKGSAVLTVTNSGNVAATGVFDFTLYLTATGAVDSSSILIGTVAHKWNIPAKKTGKISIPLGLVPSVVAGTYQLAVVVTTPAANGAPTDTAAAALSAAFTAVPLT